MREVVSLDLGGDAGFRRWQDYILAHPDTRYGDLGEWRRIFAELYGLRSVNLACVEGQRTVGVASLYLVASPFFGRLLVTCPFFGRGGLYADDAGAEAALLEAVHVAAKELCVDFVEFRLSRPLGAPYRTHAHFVEFEMPLAPTVEEVWNGSLRSNARQNVRKSEQHPLAFTTSRDAGETWRLLSRTIRDLGTPFHSRRLFDLLLEHLGPQVLFSQVRLEHRLVAAGVLVRFRDDLSTPFIGSLKRHGATRANYCQYWGILRHCVATGVRRFDLGRSPRGSTVADFKQKWGAKPTDVHYSWLPVAGRRDYRTVLDASPAERFVSAAWKRLPLPLVRVVGPWLARHIP